MGKENIYVLDLTDEQIHENEAALRIARAAAGTGIRLSDVSEGKVTLYADLNGLLKTNRDLLDRITGTYGAPVLTVLCSCSHISQISQ